MKQNARLSLRGPQVGGTQPTANDDMAITPVGHPANMLLAWLILCLPDHHQANQRKHRKQKITQEFHGSPVRDEEREFSGVPRLKEFNPIPGSSVGVEHYGSNVSQ